MRARVALLCTLFTPLAATAAPPLAFSARAPALRVDVGDETLRMNPAGAALRGDGVQLSWSGGTLSGSYRNHDIRLDARDGAVTGRVGALALRLGVAASTDGLTLKGSLGRRRIDLVAGPQRIRGELGGCRFALRSTRGRYVGLRACGDGAPTSTRVELTLPRALCTRTDAQLAAVLAVALTPRDRFADLDPGFAAPPPPGS